MPRRIQDDNEFERFRRQRQRERLQRRSGAGGFGGMGGFGGGQDMFGGGQPDYGGGQGAYGGGQAGYGGGHDAHGGGSDGFGGGAPLFGFGQPGHVDGRQDVFGGGHNAFGNGQPGPAPRSPARGDSQETRDQRISNDVRDFFEAATRQARTIVERVARGSAVEPQSNVEREVELFLLDAVERMNDFVVGRLTLQGSSDDERDFAPTLSNIVGDQLDEFREAGTASTDDKHVGKDPFLVNVQEVQRAFRERIASLRSTEEVTAAAPDGVSMVDVVDDDGVAEEDEEGQEMDPPPPPTRPKARTAVSPPTTAAPGESADVPLTAASQAETTPSSQVDVTPSTDASTVVEAPSSPSASDASAAPNADTAPATVVDPGAERPAPPVSRTPQELLALARLKQALKAMVGSGTMTRDEALAVWRKRIGG